MKRAWLAAGLCLLVAGSLAWADVPIMKVDEVRAGMKGVLRTVLKGIKPQDIPVEVIDVIRRVAPGRDIIIIRLSGEDVREVGIARGMSGSPVYIDGKLLGALSFAWRFVREPIAGVTPIEAMTQVWRRDDDKAEPVDVASWQPGETIPLQRFIDELLSPKPAFPMISPANMMTLGTPISVSGFSRQSIASLSDRLRAFDVAVVEGGGAGVPRAQVPADFTLEPGGVMCIQLIRGDLEASGVGTVTAVIGDRVYGLGHPLFNNGRVQFPMATGYIHVTVPSRDVSFKLGTSVKPVGTLVVDQANGIAGVLGKTPDMLRVSLDVKRQDLAGDAHFDFEVVKDPRLMLTFLNAAVGASVAVSGKPDAKVMIRVKATIDVEGYEPVEMEEIYGGPQASADALGIFVVPLGHILHNPYERVNVTSLRISSEVIPGDPRGVIRHVETDKGDYRPGEAMDVAVTLQPYRSKSVIRHYKLKLPDDVAKGPLRLLVCDSATDARLEGREMPHRFRPEKVAGVLDFFRRPRPNTDLVFRLSQGASGVAVEGREMPDLPASVISVLGKQPPMEVQPFLQPVVHRERTEFVVVGQHQVQVNVIRD